MKGFIILFLIQITNTIQYGEKREQNGLFVYANVVSSMSLPSLAENHANVVRNIA